MITKNELKTIKSLKIKKFRLQEGKFLVEGLKNVLELLNSEFEVTNLLCTDECKSNFTNLPYEVVSSNQLNSISTLTNNTTCIAVAKIMPFDEEQIDTSDHVIAFDGISDPGNLGTIMRSLDWFGFKQFVCTLDTTDFYNPKTIAASMGSFSRIRGIYLEIQDFVSTWKGPKYQLTLEGDDISKMKFSEPSLFVLGSESQGVSPKVAQSIGDKLTIPKYGNGESLNVAMATTILLHSLRTVG